MWFPILSLLCGDQNNMQLCFCYVWPCNFLCRGYDRWDNLLIALLLSVNFAELASYTESLTFSVSLASVQVHVLSNPWNAITSA